MVKNLLINIIASDKSARALKGVQKNLSNVKNTVFSLRGALVGLGAGAIIKSFVDVGKEVESLNIRFKFLFGSAEEGTKAFDNLSKFAGRVPFSLEQISRASGNLAVVAEDADDLNRILEITGNVAAVTGLDFETTASQIQRAFSGGIAAADIFREKGIRSLLGFEEGAKVSVAETVAAFEAAFSGTGRFARATDELAQTLEGTLSMIQDKYFNFQKAVAEEFFEELKGEFGDLNKFLEDNEKQILGYAKAIGSNLAEALLLGSQAAQAAAPPLKLVAESVGGLIGGFLSLPQWVQSTGVLGAVLGGRLGFGVLVTISAIAKAVADITKGFTADSNLSELSAELERINLAIGEQEALSFMDGMAEQAEAAIVKLKNEKEVILSLIEARKNYINQSINEILPAKEEETDLTEKTNQKLLEQYRVIDDLSKRHGTEAQLRLKALRDKEQADKEYYDELQRRRQTDLQNAIKAANDKAAAEKQAQSQILGDTENTLSILSRMNKNAFRAYQAFQIAQATINAYKGASNALATYPPPYSFLAAAAQVAQGLAYVAQIKSQSYSGRALGGRVQAGSAYMVGEGGGPEMFVPDQSGTIIPNKDLRSGPTNVYITVNANDTQGFDDLLVKRRSVIVNVINDALNSQGKEALI